MNLDDEIVVARELASNNDNKFTERIFQQNIQKFRNLLQTSTPYSLSDFEKFLKKLTSSRLFGILVDDNNQKYGVLRDDDLVGKLLKLKDIDYKIFCTIETAGDKGLWTADIRKILGLHINQVQRGVKYLYESNRLIRPITDVNYKSRKLFILSSLEPSTQITGGSFYNNGEFNELLVEKLQEQICSFLSNNQGSNLQQIITFLKETNIIRGLYIHIYWNRDKILQELLETDVNRIIKLLILENKIFNASLQNNQFIYIWCGNNNLKFIEDCFNVPCFGCNLSDSFHTENFEFIDGLKVGLVGICLSFLIWALFSILIRRYQFGKFIFGCFIGFYIFTMLKIWILDDFINNLHYSLGRLWFKFRRVIMSVEEGLYRLKLGFTYGLKDKLLFKVDRFFDNLVDDENLVKYISEGFVFGFLFFVLLIFYLITKCSDESRSLILIIFKDFFSICILSALFLVYTQNFNSLFTHWNLLKYF
ncbi:DNA-directed RNA polymerase III (-specific) subunit (RPC34) [Theileria annulata]|uniref:DNA-directed RNA polymerase III (-specific) subunit (RPC34 homologue), putative n=1 Tax=Theileria annulata TaxID=5874 RepID=Q4UHI1_THEAN|nr:DNA-directed RNA polymerase III (-specific) subunit (RPC34) [Theileria annulata]CAI73458.1 DNA-directed RNA polymerase III (-specific) subunit (RPC34 homologue), putative [Theileria annulata]|eukprot:XP_954135.1 DNA-directed RNA polymerase III (-specific) subunit (RPC34 homologue), putative [Theileria annulata]